MVQKFAATSVHFLIQRINEFLKIMTFLLADIFSSHINGQSAVNIFCRWVGSQIQECFTNAQNALGGGLKEFMLKLMFFIGFDFLFFFTKCNAVSPLNMTDDKFTPAVCQAVIESISSEMTDRQISASLKWHNYNFSINV